jgi:hypothetical protein
MLSRRSTTVNEHEASLDSLTALRAMVDPSRVRILGLLLTRPMAVEELVASLDMPAPSVSHHIRLLLEAGLIRQHAEPHRVLYSAGVDRLQEMARSLTPMGTSVGGIDTTVDGKCDIANAYDVKVLRDFFRDGRLVAIPAQEKKKDVVLRYLVNRCFPEDRGYTEREVNELLSAYHEDVASLRRFMIVGGLLTRDAGVYRRAQEGPRGRSLL